MSPVAWGTTINVIHGSSAVAELKRYPGLPDPGKIHAVIHGSSAVAELKPALVLLLNLDITTSSTAAVPWPN